MKTSSTDQMKRAEDRWIEVTMTMTAIKAYRKGWKGINYCNDALVMSMSIKVTGGIQTMSSKHKKVLDFQQLLLVDLKLFLLL